MKYVTAPFYAGPQNATGESPTLSRQREAIDEDISWYETARGLRKDPTIALARAILAAPIISNEWRVEGSNEKQVELLKKVILPMRESFMRDAVYSCMDYGWHVWETRPMRVDGTAFLQKKSLRHDNTQILIDKAGFPVAAVNESYDDQERYYSTTLKRPYFSTVHAGGEYDNPYGYALLKNAESVLNASDEVEETVSRYINKIAGAQWALWYPDGVTEDSDGNEESNAVIAKRILNSIASNGKIAMPVAADELRMMFSGNASGANARNSAWRLELIESKASSMDPFLERQRYLDALKMRALLVPERTAVEGQFGTKAEASEHGDVGLSAIEQWSHEIIECFNSPYGPVGAVLEMNGEKWAPGGAYVVPLPLADDDKMFMREIFRTVVNNLKNYAAVLDIEKLAERTNIPVHENANEKAEEAAKNDQQKPPVSGQQPGEQPVPDSEAELPPSGERD